MTVAIRVLKIVIPTRYTHRIPAVGSGKSAIVERIASLSDFGNRLSQVGRGQEALTPAVAAVSLYRQLAAEQLGLRPALASALDALGSHYGVIGRYREGLEGCKTDLARAPSNLSSHYDQLDRTAEACACAVEAVDINRVLVFDVDAAARRA